MIGRSDRGTGLRILVVDDDAQIRRALRTSLQARGHDVQTAPNGEAALEMASVDAFDLVILDLGLPEMDGHEVIARMRSWSEVPIIVLSVREAQDEKVSALEAGADDYVTKPFAIEELEARVRAVRRRATTESVRPILRFGELTVDLPRQAVWIHDELVHLTATEYRLLEAMATQPGKLLTHGWLLQKVWGPGYTTESQYLRVFVRQLRQKLGDDAGHPRYIVTESGLGYRWKPEPDDP